MVPIGFLDVCTIEIIVVIYIDIDIVAAPIDVAPQSGADRDTSSEPESASRHISWRIVIIWRVGWIGPCAINNCRIVSGHVDNFGARRRNHDDLA